MPNVRIALCELIDINSTAVSYWQKHFIRQNNFYQTYYSLIKRIRYNNKRKLHVKRNLTYLPFDLVHRSFNCYLKHFSSCI